MSGLGAILLSIMMLACFGLVGGGLSLIAKRRDRTKGVLMLIAAAVILANVLIWTL